LQKREVCLLKKNVPEPKTLILQNNSAKSDILKAVDFVAKAWDNELLDKRIEKASNIITSITSNSN